MVNFHFTYITDNYVDIGSGSRECSDWCKRKAGEISEETHTTCDTASWS